MFSENDSLRVMEEKTTDDAKDEDSEGARVSTPSSVAVTQDTENDADVSEDGDPRLITPRSTKEAESIEKALSTTRAHYLQLTGEFAQSPLPSENYLTQWWFLQEQLKAYWAHNGRSGDPPKLFILHPWRGGLAGLEYQDSENSNSDS